MEDIDLEEGNGDSKENVILNFVNDSSQMVGRVHMSSRSNTKSKEKKIEHHESRAEKKRSFGIGVQLLSKWDQLIEIMSTKSDSTSAHMDRSCCSIPRVMVELHSICGVSVDDDFHDFTTEYQGLQRKRKMWYSIGSLEQKLKWLQRMYA